MLVERKRTLTKMGLTKVEMWISIIGLVLIFAFSINILGGDLLNSDVTLDQRSVDYVDKFSTNIDNNSFDDYAQNTTLEEKKTNPIVDIATSLPIISDVVGGINFFIDKTKGVMSGLSLVYNLPTFFLQGFGLPVEDFRHVINIIAFILLLSFTIILVRLVK